MYTDALDDITNKYDNKYHRTITTKPFDLKLSTYTAVEVKSKDTGLKCKGGDHVRISKYRNIFGKVYTLFWSG